MSKLGTYTRRGFLIGSAAIAGGVAFGVYQVEKAPPNPLAAQAGGATLNPYVLIDGDGVTIVTPRAEMGQGVHTTLAALVAEELDLDWQDVRTMHGPPAQAYYNQALLGAALPYAEYGLTGFQHGIKDRLGRLAKPLSLQVTGGSTSMVDGFDKMRRAGASAREALKAAAAARLGVAAADLRTEAGAVVAPDGTRLPYTELAAEAAALDAPQVEPRPASDWRFLGQEMPRVDMVAKSTGTATFGLDVRLPGMKFAALRASPKRAGMISFDASEAEAMPGVERVIALPDGIAVVASNTWLAFRAAEAVRIEWEPAPYPESGEEMLQAIARSFDGEANSILRDAGDAEAVPAGATFLEAEYTVPWLAHATMEPMNATALFTGDALEVWCGNQAPVVVRDRCAEAVGLDGEAVTVHTTYLGGGFGRRGEYDYARYAALVAQAMPGVPVQLAWSREEDMRRDFYRPAAMARFRGAVAEGRAVTVHGKIAGPSVTKQSARRIAGFAPPGSDKGHVEGAFDQPYAIPNYRIEGYLADLGVPVGFWRSVGNSFNGFFFDSFLDEMAHAAGADPLEFRLDLMRGEHAPSAGTLEAVREMSGWTGRTPPGVGRGVAFTYSFGTPVAQVIELRQTDAGIRIAKAWIAADLGTVLDPAIVRAQMESGLIYGLSAAVMGEITFEGGEVQQQNFPDYDALRIHQAPETEVRLLEAGAHIGGAGEPGTPPAAPALGNALYDLTGQRIRQLPFNRSFDFVV